MLKIKITYEGNFFNRRHLPLRSQRMKMCSDDLSLLTPGDKLLLRKMKDHYDILSFETIQKVAVLVDIYGGHELDGLYMNKRLHAYYSTRLIQLCITNKSTIPVLKGRNLSVSFYKQILKNAELVVNHSIQVPKTTAPHLMKIQNQFCTSSLSPLETVSFKTFWHANDGRYIHNYFKNCFNYVYLSKAKELDLMHETSSSNQIGIVVGNGNIFSVLPEIPADDVLLLDIEPAIHYFLFAIRELILLTDVNSSDVDYDFEVIKKNLIDKIRFIEMRLWILNKKIGSSLTILEDMEQKGLEDKHFLSSFARFNECRDALKSKALLPIEMSLFDTKKMGFLANILRTSACEVSFMNITNVGDYDDDCLLYNSIRQLPFATVFKIINTVHTKHCCLVSTSLSELQYALEYSEHKTTKEQQVSFIYLPDEAISHQAKNTRDNMCIIS